MTPRPLLVLVGLLVACGGPASSAATPEPTTTGVVPLTEITAAARPAAVSVRVDPPTITVAVGTPPVPTAPVGLHGLPFAPDGLDPCADMEFYRVQAGLPDRFQALGYRESRCLNRDDVRTWCCWGHYQLWVDLHLRDHRAGPVFRDHCAIYSYDDVNSNTPLDKQRQACGAKALFDIVGYQAWALS